MPNLTLFLQLRRVGLVETSNMRFMDFSRPNLFAGSPSTTYDWSIRDPVFFAPS